MPMPIRRYGVRDPSWKFDRIPSRPHPQNSDNQVS